MIQLIKKDLAIHKLSWLLYFGMMIFFMGFNKDVIFVIAIISAIVIMNTFYFDELAHGHKLWNSLPFTRKEIVSARYCSLIVVTMLITIIVMGVEGILNGGWSYVAWEEVIGSFIVMTLSSSIFFPLIYKFSQPKIIFTFVLLYTGSVIGGVYGIYYSYDYLVEMTSFFHKISIGTFWGMLALGSVLWYFISWSLSLKIYKAKELF